MRKEAQLKRSLIKERKQAHLKKGNGLDQRQKRDSINEGKMLDNKREKIGSIIERKQALLDEIEKRCSIKDLKVSISSFPGL